MFKIHECTITLIHYFILFSILEPNNYQYMGFYAFLKMKGLVSHRIKYV
jgi:hypothetical protein